jgi:hypothetical protein
VSGRVVLLCEGDYYTKTVRMCGELVRYTRPLVKEA